MVQPNSLRLWKNITFNMFFVFAIFAFLHDGRSMPTIYSFDGESNNLFRTNSSPKATLLIYCDLTLEDDVQIESMINSAKMIMMEDLPDESVLLFYAVGPGMDQLIYKYVYPSIKIKIKGTSEKAIHRYKLKRQDERNKLKEDRKSKSIELVDKLRKLHASLYAKSRTISMSCIGRGLSVAQGVLGESHERKFKTYLVFLSDMVVRCQDTVCGSQMNFNKPNFKRLKSQLAKCYEHIDLSFIDDLIVVSCRDYFTEDIKKELNPEFLFDLWVIIFEAAKVPAQSYNGLSFHKFLPSPLLHDKSY